MHRQLHNEQMNRENKSNCVPFQRQSQSYVLLEASAIISATITQREQPDVWILAAKHRSVSSRWTI